MKSMAQVAIVMGSNSDLPVVKGAITQLKKATEAKTDDFNAWYYLAFSYRNNNDTKKANKIFRQIVQQFPTQAAA